MSDQPITDTLAVRTLAKMTDDLMADIDRRDATIDDLRERLARMTIERDGTHEANVALFADKARLIREVTLLQAERAEGWGR